MQMKVLALTVALASGGSVAHARQDEARTDRPQSESTPSAPQRGRAEVGDEPKPGLNRDTAIGHALCMAIEGSDLWCSARRTSGTAAPLDRTRNADANVAVPALAPAPATTGHMGGEGSRMLQQHAQDAFQASQKLFQAVRQDRGAGDERGGFFQAAWEYSRTLQGLCGQTGLADRPGNVEPGSGAFAGEEARAARAIRAESAPGVNLSQDDMARLTLINHAVKEAVQGVGLRRMLQEHAAQDRASQVLLSHAERMIVSSRQAIQSLDHPAVRDRAAGTSPAPLTPAARSLAEVRDGNDDRQEAAGVATRADAPVGGELTATATQIDQLVRLGRQVIDSIQGQDEAGAAGTIRSDDRPADAFRGERAIPAPDARRDPNTNVEGRSRTNRDDANPARGNDQPAPGRPQTGTGPTNNAARPGR
jgi:hypothetical protein